MPRKAKCQLTIYGVVALLGGGALTTALAAPTRQTGGPEAGQATGHSIHWEGIPLRDAVTRLNAVSESVVVFLDRRADPSERIDLTLQSASVRRVVDELGAKCSLGVSQWDELIYLGPQERADQLATLAAIRRQEVAGLAADVRRSLSKRKRINWPRLTEPRELVVQLAQEHGWRVAGSERIPHDLWAAGRLPTSALSDQLTVLLIGFDQTFRVRPHESVIEIVPIAKSVSLSREYSLPTIHKTSIASLAERYPDMHLEFAGGKLRAKGRWEELQEISQLVRGSNSKSPKPRGRPLPSNKQVFTLRVEEQPVGGVLEKLAQQLGWELVVDEAAIRRSGRSLDRRVSFAVTNADVEELLAALLEPAGLTFERNESQVRIGPR
jgi:hypothetical protein